MKSKLAILYGQAPEFSTSFQTRELARHLEPWFDVNHFEVRSGASFFGRQIARLSQNLFSPAYKFPSGNFLLYGNDGFVDLRRVAAKRILYWYDAPEDWSLHKPTGFKDRIRYQNVLAADHVFAVSAAQLGVAKKLRRGREHSVHYLPVGVDCAFFDPALVDRIAARHRFGINPREVTIGYLGYLGRWKNRFAGEALLEAAPLLKDHKFLIIGSGPALADWKKRVAELGLEKQFIFTGFIPLSDLPAAIAVTDICVDTLEPGFHSEARSETKLKQYMAMARACVATDIGENRVDLDDGRAGLLTAPNPAALAEAIVRLANDSAERERLGKLARARAQNVYSWELHARALAERVLGTS